MIRNNAKACRDEASRARLLSASMFTADTVAVLTEYAVECEARANALDADQTDQNKDPTSRDLRPARAGESSGN